MASIPQDMTEQPGGGTTGPKIVAVIGAGIAGLVTAKTLAEDGFDVRVFEKGPDLGGTWAASRTYPGLRTNNTKQTYEFSDHPYPDDAELSPRADEVRSYLESYADRFGIRERIRFNHEVVSVERSTRTPAGLTVRYRHGDGSSADDACEADFVVVCNGVFHRPQMPVVPGTEAFTGKILHSSQVTESTYAVGDRVIVVGGGKSALDCAAYAARQALNPTLVFRRAQWMAPRFLPGGKIPGDWLVTSRFLASLLRYHRTGTGGQWLHSVGTPLVRLWWTIIGLGWRKDLKIPASMMPKDRLPAGLEKIGVGGDFYEAVNAGRARAVQGTISRFTERGIELADGTALPADVVVFATGWHQSIAFLSDELQREIAGQGYIRLFRQILPPTAQNIGFVGYASSVASQLTAEIGAHWLSEHFLGALALPSVQAMNEEIDRVHAWADEYLPNRGTEGFVGPYLSPYVDELMRDMRLPVRRSRGFFTEHFGVFRASRYAGLTAERRQARRHPSP
jgi:cation diffusion facilitator CzcD-associated flavoprotein CzcO